MRGTTDFEEWAEHKSYCNSNKGINLISRCAICWPSQSSKTFMQSVNSALTVSRIIDSQYNMSLQLHVSLETFTLVQTRSFHNHE